MGVERDTVGLCPLLAPPDDVGRQGDSRLVLGSGKATTVPADPQRIVVLDTPSLDAACTVGIWERVVGAATAPALNAPDALRPTYLGTGISQIAGVGPVGSPDLAQIAALSPDLIVGSDSLGAEMSARIGEIAPTVLTRSSASWSDRSLLAATAMGRREAATAELAKFRTDAADIGRQIVASQTEASVVRFGPDYGQIPGSDSFAGQVLGAAGVRRPFAQMSTTTNFDTADPAPAEGDLIYVMFAPGGLDNGTAILRTDAWRDLGAVVDGRVFAVDDAVWSGEGIIAAETMLTDLKNSLNAYVS
ncbi:hypothetical protein GCM10007304_20170 [Rhodococcoides trifolii]|uniref:Fe/B12 periplasmic-binding domain-containing protein n=1 Tax=Rhodococcoides trifolii TaxID=908250 RepID=A0A917FW21_9NOCA|nr:hypothetical protein GCM10007304_20170 [Rhodococcus trifolii]